jgi:hypothetical protein
MCRPRRGELVPNIADLRAFKILLDGDRSRPGQRRHSRPLASIKADPYQTMSATVIPDEEHLDNRPPRTI